MVTRLVSIILVLVLVAGLAVFASSCAKKEEGSGKIAVAVSILPQAEFVERVGGEKVKVSVMVPPGADPHTYEPTPSQLAALSKAKLFAKVGSGVEFELAWMDKLTATNPDMLVVDCARGIELMEIEGEHEAEHHHQGKDPHIWLSPKNAKIMVENICHGLIQVDPENKGYYLQNKDEYLSELDKLDEEIRNSLARITRRSFIVFHPAWGYFARDYGLKQIPVEVEGKEPSVKDIANLIAEAKKHEIKVIFASPQFNVKGAEVIAKGIKGRVVFVDPLARDYVANLSLVREELKKGLVECPARKQ